MTLAPLLCACAAAAARPAPSPRAVVLEIRSFAFPPADSGVRVGDSVIWVNRDALPHTATSDSGAWSSPELPSGGRFVFVPKRAGRFSYHCAAHPVMRAVLVVRD